MNYVIDAKNKVLGRLASEIASILQGKKSPAYNPQFPGADTVVVKNASQIVVTGRKRKEKMYYRHSGHVGHLKALRFEQIMARDPRKIIEYAVLRMLPKNRLARRRLKRLTIEI